jgi:hypothetical protein
MNDELQIPNYESGSIYAQMCHSTSFVIRNSQFVIRN